MDFVRIPRIQMIIGSPDLNDAGKVIVHHVLPKCSHQSAWRALMDKFLVDGCSPTHLKNIRIRQLGSWNPKVRGENKNYLKPPPWFWLSKTLPKTNSSPIKTMVSDRNILFQGSIFTGYVSFLRLPVKKTRNTIWKSNDRYQLLNDFQSNQW